MPYPFHKNEIGSETGIEEDYQPRGIKVGSDFDWLASIRNIFINLSDMIRIILKWR